MVVALVSNTKRCVDLNEGQQTALQECKAKKTLAQTRCRYCLECSMSSNKHNLFLLGRSSEPGKEKEDCLSSNDITNSCDNNISFQDRTTLQDHLLHLKHVDHLGMDGHKRDNNCLWINAAYFLSEAIIGFLFPKKLQN